MNSNSNHKEDITLVNKCIEGNEASWKTLKKKYQPVIKHHIKKLHTNQWASSVDYLEVSADIWNHLMKNNFKALKKYSGKSTFKTWFSRVSRNKVVDFLREGNRKKAPETATSHKLNDNCEFAEEYNNVADPGGSPEQAVLSKEKTAQVRKALAALTPKDRLIIKLKYYESFSSKRVAGIMNISEQNVNTKYHRAVKQLKQKLSKYMTG